MKLSRVVVLLFTITGVLVQLRCGGAASSSTPSGSATSSASNVFAVVLENHSYSSVIGSPNMPYLNSLVSKFGLATNYFANTHPSIGNYFMMTTGQIITNNDNFPGTVDTDNVVRELTAAGKTWKGYFGGLPSAGYIGGDVGPYVKHHNPFAFFTDVINSPALQANLVPATQLATDIAAGQLPQYGFIVPDEFSNADLCRPRVACTDAVLLGNADTWLKNNIDPLINSPAFQKSGLLFILFDESDQTDNANGGGHIAAVVVGPGVKSGFQSAVLYQHQNLLRTMLQVIGVNTFPGAAANANAMTDFLIPKQ